MNITIRTNGNEPYKKVKVSKAKAKRMENAGHFTDYNYQFGYIDGEVFHYNFEFEGKKYKIEYFSGCFNPFLLELI
jgi:spermidine/putrescine-binding protein